MCIPQRKRVGCEDKTTLIRFFSPLYLITTLPSRERRRRILPLKGDSSYASLSVSLSLQNERQQRHHPSSRVFLLFQKHRRRREEEKDAREEIDVDGTRVRRRRRKRRNGEEHYRQTNVRGFRKTVPEVERNPRERGDNPDGKREQREQQHRVGRRRRREPFSRGCKNANFGNSRAYFFAFFREL